MLREKPSEFRFHTGSIKSTRDISQLYQCLSFRFHTGSIKSRRLLTVRVTKKFRFHTGSIKS